MKYYTDTIPLPLAEKLKEKGMHQLRDSRMEGWLNSGDNITYAEAFDWLMSRGFACEVYGRGSGYDYVIVKECNDATRGTNLAHNNYEGPNGGACWNTWHEAAEKAIEKALELI